MSDIVLPLLEQNANGNWDFVTRVISVCRVCAAKHQVRMRWFNAGDSGKEFCEVCNSRHIHYVKGDNYNYYPVRDVQLTSLDELWDWNKIQSEQLLGAREL